MCGLLCPSVWAPFRGCLCPLGAGSPAASPGLSSPPFRSQAKCGLTIPKAPTEAPGHASQFWLTWPDHDHCGKIAVGGGGAPCLEPGRGVSPRLPLDGAPRWTGPCTRRRHTGWGNGRGRLRKVQWLWDVSGHSVPKALESTDDAQWCPILSLGNSPPVPAGNSVIKPPLLTCQSCFWGTDADSLGDLVGI